MSEELSKIERPAVTAFSGKRKLYIVPLLYSWPEAEKEYTTLFERYWQDVEGQLKHLQERIGAVKHVFHEGIDESGETALAALEGYNPQSHGLVRSLIQAGADLVSIEDRNLITQSYDWERFVMLGFANTKVAATVTEHYRNAMKERYDHVVKKIEAALQSDEAGVLFIGEGHPIQFPKEIEVFSVFPPSLDEIHRYMRNRRIKHAEHEHNDSCDEQTEAEAGSSESETGSPTSEG